MYYNVILSRLTGNIRTSSPARRHCSTAMIPKGKPLIQASSALDRVPLLSCYLMLIQRMKVFNPLMTNPGCPLDAAQCRHIFIAVQMSTGSHISADAAAFTRLLLLFILPYAFWFATTSAYFQLQKLLKYQKLCKDIYCIQLLSVFYAMSFIQHVSK